MRQWKTKILSAVLAGGLILAGAAEALACPRPIQEQVSSKQYQTGGKKVGVNNFRRVGINNNRNGRRVDNFRRVGGNIDTNRVNGVNFR